jgi:hypothetical protein
VGEGREGKGLGGRDWEAFGDELLENTLEETHAFLVLCLCLCSIDPISSTCKSMPCRLYLIYRDKKNYERVKEGVAIAGEGDWSQIRRQQKD